MPAYYSITINFDENIEKVEFDTTVNTIIWATSGEKYSIYGINNPFRVTLKDGYIIDTVTSDRIGINNITENTFKTLVDANGTISITSKQATPTTGTIKFGSNAPTKYYLGDKAVDRIYMGTVLLYKKAIVYTITVNLANCTANSDNPITIEENGGAILYFTANDGYELPDGVELTNITSYNWDKTTGKLVLARPTGNVTIKIEAVETAPQLATPKYISVENNVVSWDGVDGAEQYDVYVDGTIYAENVIESTETWVLNDTIDISTEFTTTATFDTNNETATSIAVQSSAFPKGLIYYIGAPVIAYNSSGWTNTAYKTITFDQPVTDSTLLAWLQANGTKQGGGK